MDQTQKIDMAEADGVVDEWITKWKEGLLSHVDIQNYWCARLPKVEYDPNEMRSKYEDVLISTLEKFIFFGESPQNVEMTCRQNEQNTSCCKVLDQSECFYTCEDCKLTENGNCGLCVECFKTSEHRGHRYRLKIGADNEICCCGQTENWKSGVGCSKHLMSKNITDFVPKELTSRAAIAMEAILRYNADLLDEKELIAEYSCWDEDSYCRVMYSHGKGIQNVALKQLPTTEDIIQQVKNLEEEGVIVYRHGSKEYCENVSEVVEMHTSIIHFHEALRRNFAVRLLKCLEKILNYSRDFRKIFTELVAKPLSLQECFMEKFFIKAWNTFSEKFRCYCYKLLVSGTLKEYDNKKILAKEILKMYRKLSNQCVIGENGEMVPYNFFAFARHFFSDPGISNYLMEKEFALTILSKSLFEEPAFFDELREVNISEDDAYPFERSFETLAHVQMLLSSGPRKWTQNLRENFRDGLEYFLNLLSNMHKFHLNIREVTNYRVYEADHDIVFESLRKFGKCGGNFLKWCGEDKEVLLEAYKATLMILQDNFPDDFNQETETVVLVNHSARCLPLNSEIETASFCLSLTRFLAGLTLLFESHGITFNSVEVNTLKSIVLSIVDPVLKLQVMIAQGSAGFWERNSYLFPSTVNKYLEYEQRIEIFDRDIQVFQIAASILDPNEFLIHVLHNYGMIYWFEPNLEESLNETDEEEIKELKCLVEHFLKFVINVVTERYVPGIGCVTNRDRVKHELIHDLCIEPRSHRRFKRSLFQYLDKDVDLDEIINEVAIFKTPESELYELKENFYAQYNPMFYHYTPRAMMEAREFQLKRRKAAKQPAFFPPPELPKLNQSFSSMVNIFQSDVLLNIMQKVIERSIDVNSKSYSDLQLEHVLYLIGFALLDEESGNYDFLSFVEKAVEWKIFDLLEQLLTSARNGLPQDLIKWLLRKYNSLAGNFSDTNPLEGSSTTLENKRLLAAERRAKIMAEMAKSRNQFMENNCISDELDETSPSEIKAEKTCLLCQKTQSIDLQNEPFIVLGNVQISTVLWTERKKISEAIELPLLSSSLGPAYFTSTCGQQSTKAVG